MNTFQFARTIGATVLATAIAAGCGDGESSDPAKPIVTAADTNQPAPFDIVRTEIVTDNGDAVFRTQVRAGAGTMVPASIGTFENSSVYSYVWPTSLNSSDVGFDADQGIVALAVTFHPDFDDGAYGGKNREIWHSHWVVLVEDASCAGGLTVKDIPEGTTPKLPPTWPGAPILIDSPDYGPVFTSDTVEVRVPLAKLGALASASFDGVTAGLQVNANLHAPFLCVANVFKIASGDLSLPGQVGPGR